MRLSEDGSLIKAMATLVQAYWVRRPLCRVDAQFFGAKLCRPRFEVTDELTAQATPLQARIDRELAERGDFRTRVPFAMRGPPTRR
jgi:hypothetical protein